MSAPFEGFVPVDGARLHYEIAGSGPPIILIHSGITDSRSWEPQFAQFAQHFRVVRYDLRGFGRSDVPHGSYSNLADLTSLMDAVAFPRAALVGVSVGGSLALDLALEHPDRVSALVLVGSGFSGRQPSEQWKAVMAEVHSLFEGGLIDAAVERELEIWLYGKGRSSDDVDPAIREAVRKMDRHAAERYSADARPQPVDRPAAGRLGEIAIPTLIVVGDLDVDEIQEAAKFLGRGIAGAKLVVMQGTAHVPNMEQPEAFNRLVIDFLRSVV